MKQDKSKYANTKHLNSFKTHNNKMGNKIPTNTQKWVFTLVALFVLSVTVYAATVISDTQITTDSATITNISTDLINATDIYDKTDIRYYGAIPDDDIDDWEAIQTAINTTYLNGWGELNFPSGVWDISKTLRFYESINYKGTMQRGSSAGVDGGTTIKLMASSNVTVIDLAPFVEGDAPTFVSMQDFLIEGNKNNQEEENVGFLIRGQIKDVFIRRVYVNAVKGPCWELKANKMYLTEVYAEGCEGYGFFLNGSNSTSWGKNIIADTLYSFGNDNSDLFINGTAIEWVQVNHGKLGRGDNESALEISGGNENRTMIFSDIIFASGSGSSPANQQDIVKLNAGAKNVIFNNVEISGDNAGSGLTPRYGIFIDPSLTSDDYSFNNLIFTGEFGTGRTNGAEYTFKNVSNLIFNNLGIVMDGNLTINELSGSGNDFACLDSTGKLFRSDASC